MALKIRTRRHTRSRIGAPVACQYPLDFCFHGGLRVAQVPSLARRSPPRATGKPPNKQTNKQTNKHGGLGMGNQSRIMREARVTIGTTMGRTCYALPFGEAPDRSNLHSTHVSAALAVSSALPWLSRYVFKKAYGAFLSMRRGPGKNRTMVRWTLRAVRRSLHPWCTPGSNWHRGGTYGIRRHASAAATPGRSQSTRPCRSLQEPGFLFLSIITLGSSCGRPETLELRRRVTQSRSRRKLDAKDRQVYHS